MIIGTIDIVGAKIFNWPLLGMMEATEELMVGMVFLVIGQLALKEDHIRINILDRFMPRLVRFILRVAGLVLGIVVTGIVCWRSFVLFQYAVREDVGKPDLILIHFPLWPGTLTVCLGSLFLAIAFIFVLGKLLIYDSKE